MTDMNGNIVEVGDYVWTMHNLDTPKQMTIGLVIQIDPEQYYDYVFSVKMIADFNGRIVLNRSASEIRLATIEEYTLFLFES